MGDFLPFVVIGIATGSVYGIAGMGLVLTYKTSGILNFAHGAIATAAAFAFFEFHVHNELPWPIAALLSLMVVGVGSGLAFERLARGLTLASPAMKIVATVGVLLAVQAIAVVRYGRAAQAFPQYLPSETRRVLSVNVSDDQIIVVVVALVSAIGLYGFFSRTRLGVATRALVDDPDLLGLAGISPSAVRRRAWVIGSVFAALSGILLAPTVSLDATLLTLLIVQAFGAAAIGGFVSLPLTYVGGLVIGVAAAVSTKYIGDLPLLSGVPSSLPFIVLFGVLILARSGSFVEVGRVAHRGVATVGKSSPRRAWTGVLAAAVLVLVPFVVGTRLSLWTNGMAFAVIFLSLSLLVRTSGQVSLCQAGFAAVGAASFAHFTTDFGLPWPFAVMAAGAVTIPVAAIVAIPAMRLSGVYLALATFGFAVLLERLAYKTFLMFGGGDRLAAARPSIARGDTAYYFVVLLGLGLSYAFVRLIVGSRLGRLLRAMSDSPVALANSGTNVNLTRLLVFCASGFLAGIGGALLGPVTGSTNATPFNAFQSLLFLVVLAIAGSGTMRPAIIAALSLVVAPAYVFEFVIDARFSDYLPILFGLAAVAVALADGARVGLRMPTGARTSERATGRSPVSNRLPGAVAGGSVT